MTKAVLRVDTRGQLMAARTVVRWAEHWDALTVELTVLQRAELTAADWAVLTAERLADSTGRYWVVRTVLKRAVKTVLSTAARRVSH